MAWEDKYLDAVLVPVGMFLLLAYHFHLYLQVKHRPLKTVIGINHHSRRAWVFSIMRDNDKKNILAVQSLRNGIMASTFMATISITLVSAIAAFIAGTNSLRQNLNEVIVGSKLTSVVTLKFFGLIVCFFFAFICNMQSIRYMNHVNFLINIPPADCPGVTPDYVADVLQRGANSFTVGSRGFYFAFPLLFWVFGPIPCFVSCVLMVPLLYYLDSTKDLAFCAVAQRPAGDEERGGEQGREPRSR